jgi:hypothetical protein
MTISRKAFLGALAGMATLAVAGDLATTEVQAKTKKSGTKKGGRQTPPTSQAAPPKPPLPSGY